MSLRRIAQEASRHSGFRIEPVSLLHSSKVPKAALGGVSAKTLKRTLSQQLEAGRRQFICLPLFLGPSRAITEYLPEIVRDFRRQYPDMQLEIADSLAGADSELPDIRLAKMLAKKVLECVTDCRCHLPKVALVDHGTPYLPVNRVRNRVAEQLRLELGAHVATVCASSMERREGAAYDFNEPLLERLGACDGMRGGELILAMFFLLPGRHAGDGGDVHQICDGLIQAGDFDAIYRTDLLGTDPMLLDIIKDRLEAVIGRFQ